MRKFLLPFLAATFLLASCASIDATQIAALIKAACSIAVPITDIAKIIDADKAQTPAAIVNVICSAYKSSMPPATASAPSAPSASAAPRTIVVHVNGKDIAINVTPTN